MILRNLALLRFDFVLGEATRELIEELEDSFGDPTNKLSTKDIRGNEQVQLAFETDPELVGLPDEFDSLTIRVVETTDAVTEIVTLAIINLDELDNGVSEKASGVNFVQRQDWEHRLESIRTFIPGEELGPETTIHWLNFESLPEELERETIDLEDVNQVLSEDEMREVLESFNVSTSGGTVLLDEDTLLLSRDPSHWWGNLLAVDLDENLSTTESLDGLNLHGPWPALSTLYGAHYWSQSRGIELDEFEDGLDEADTELPSGNKINADQYLDLEATIYDLQEEWVPLNSKISRELRQLQRRLDTLDVDIKGISRSQLQSGETSDGNGPLHIYTKQLETELERVEFDSSRLDERLNSLSNVFHNRVSIIATQENIDLQQQVSDQTEQSLKLQSRVSMFTVAVVLLTVVLVIDAFSSGGLAAIVDRLFNEGLDGVTSQMIVGFLILAIFSVGTLVYLLRDSLSLYTSGNQG